MKKKVCLMLALLMLASSMFACAESGENTDPVSAETTATDAAPSAGEETVAEEEEAESFDPGLPATDFEGRIFNILTKAGWTDDWFESSIYTEELNGEVLNDAVFERNLYVQETYNVEIAEIAGESGNFVSNVQNAVTAGDICTTSLCPPSTTRVPSQSTVISTTSLPWIISTSNRNGGTPVPSKT